MTATRSVSATAPATPDRRAEPVSAQSSSASKRQRDIDKRSRAAEKRDRRQRRGEASSEDPSNDDGSVVAETPPGDSGPILERIERLQREFEANVIDFETYDARKAELLSHLQI